MDVFQCDTTGRTALGESGRHSRTLENPKISLHDVEAWDELFGDVLSTTGVRISRDAALKLSGFLRGVHLIAARIAELPIYVWEEKESESYAIDRSHRANKFLRLAAIPGEMSALTWKHTLQSHALIHGNGYGYAPQNGRGEVIELLPLLPDRTRPVRINGRLRYATSIGGALEDEQSEVRFLDPDEVIHLKGLGWDGYSGYSTLRMGREVLGGALATQQYGNAFFGQGTAVGLVIETDQALSDPAYARMKNLWHKTRAGLKAAHKAAILEEGAKAKTLALSAQDAQLLESKRFDLTLIEHLLGLPPGTLSGRTNQRNAEADAQELVDNCLSWWLTSWESEFSWKLLTTEEYESEKRKIMFDRKALIRSNMAAQAMYWRTALGGRAWANQQEARRATGLDPSKGKTDILDPLNMGSLPDSADGGTLKEKYSARRQKAEGRRQKAEERRLALRETHRAIVSDAVSRMAKRVATFVERQFVVPPLGGARTAPPPKGGTTNCGTTNLLAKFDADHAGVIREALSVVSPLTRAGKLDEWFLTTVRAPLQALVDGEPETSRESLARFFEGLPARAAELV
jgi:HK97 family phage portal protein